MKQLGMMVAVLLGAVACGPSSGISGETGEPGAKVIAEKLKSDPATLGALRPSEADLKELFDDSTVEPMKAYVEKMYTELKTVELKEDPSAVQCYETDEIKAWKDVQRLPGGYQRLGDKLKPGVVVCAFKSGGTSWDGLMWIGGKWFFIAKPFRALPKE